MSAAVALVALVALLVAAFLLPARRRPRITLEQSPEEVVVVLHGWDAVYSLRRRIVVPRRLLARVFADDRGDVPARGLRVPGTALPGVIRAGTYRADGRREFWDVRRADRVLVLDCVEPAPFHRIVLEVADPDGEAARLQAEA